MDEPESERKWRRTARRVARKVNAGWWLESATPWLIALSLAAAVAIVCHRTLNEAELGWPEAGAVAGLSMFVSLVAGWLVSRKRFIGEREGLVRLEARLRLDNALSAAEGRVGAWPASAVEGDVSGFSWRLSRTALPLAVSLAVVAAAAAVPVPRIEAAAKLPPAEPGAWNQMEEWLATLDEEELIDEKAIEEWREKVEELRSQPEDEWFSHATMEASDTLRESLRRDLEELAEDVAAAERSLEALRRHGERLGEKGREQAAREAGEAIGGMQTGNLPMDENWREALEGLDPESLSSGQSRHLTPEQMEAMSEALSEVAEGLGSMEGFP